MSHLLARQRSSSSLHRKNSDSSTATPSNQKPREFKSAPYTRPSYVTILATKGSLMDMDEAEEDILRLKTVTTSNPKQSINYSNRYDS